MQLATDRGTKPNNLQAEFVPYEFPSSTHPGYKALCAEREASGIKVLCMSDSTGDCKYGPARTMTIETAHIFGNQWNTAPDEYSDKGFRVFNWYEEYFNRRSDKRGHYLKITEEMRELCRLTHVCGYCGAGYYGIENAGRFCSACLDSEYLKEPDLCLLRVMAVPINGTCGVNRAPLSDAEKEWLTPLYVERQTTGTDSRMAQKMKQKRIRVLEDYEATITKATAERDGFIWLLDHNINPDNAIYYNHTGRWCFGWHSPLSPEVRSKLLDLLSEFPFEYDLK